MSQRTPSVLRLTWNGWPTVASTPTTGVSAPASRSTQRASLSAQHPQLSVRLDVRLPGAGGCADQAASGTRTAAARRRGSSADPTETPGSEYGGRMHDDEEMLLLLRAIFLVGGGMGEGGKGMEMWHTGIERRRITIYSAEMRAAWPRRPGRGGVYPSQKKKFFFRWVLGLFKARRRRTRVVTPFTRTARASYLLADHGFFLFVRAGSLVVRRR